MAVADASSVCFEARGTIEGQIAPAPRGEGGFGYDPIFFYPPFGCTLAEVGSRKSAVSHRGEAFRAFRAWLAAQATGRSRAGFSMFSLSTVVPWGRSFDEYQRMFALTRGSRASHPRLW